MALFLNGKQIDKEQVYADNIPMSASESDTIADKFDGLNAELLPIESGSATNTKDYIDSGLSGKADKSSLPNYITQPSGQTAQFRSIGVFFYYYADQWNAHIPFPFVTKNTNYTITLNEVIAENIGDITNKCSVIGKASTYFDIQTTKTMTALPNSFSVCVCRCLYTIQWS